MGNDLWPVVTAGDRGREDAELWEALWQVSRSMSLSGPQLVQGPQLVHTVYAAADLCALSAGLSSVEITAVKRCVIRGCVTPVPSYQRM